MEGPPWHRLSLDVPAGGVLKLVAPTFHRARMGSDVLIPCTFTIDKPPVDTGQLALSWRFQEREVLTYNNKMSSTHPRASINTARIKDGDVSLYISNTTISDGGIYTCSMSYSAERQDKEIRLDIEDLSVKHRVAVGGASFVTVLLAAVAIFLVYHRRHKKRNIPRVQEITRCGDGTFSLDVDHFAPKDISFSWHLVQPPSSTEKQQLESTLIMSENQDGTSNATSTCDNLRGKVNVTQPYTIQAVVTHPRLKQPVCKEWTSDLQDGYKLRPIVTRPLQLSLCDPGEVLCSLYLESFYPKHIDISWSCDTGQSQKDISPQEKYQENPDQSYNAESACKIPGDSLKDPEFKVIVRWKHETMEDWESRELCVRDPGFPWRPNITDMSPLIILPNQQTRLKCTVSGYFPDVLTVMWFMKNARQETIPVSNGSKYEIAEISQEKMSDNTYTCTSTLCFTPTSNSEEQEFICRVSYPSLEEPIERSTGPARTKVSPTVTEPIKFSLCESGDVLCSLYVSKFYPQNINITWTSGRDQINRIKSVEKFIKISDETTCNAISECRIKWDQSLFPLRVTWKHESMEEPEYKELGITDFPWIPAVGEISVPALYVGSECTMQCDINNYYPDNNLTVTWIKEKGGQRLTVSPNIRYKIPDLQHVKQRDHTYSCTACLDFIPSYELDDGAVFTCRVEHPSLKPPIERRTERLHVMAAPVMVSPIQFLLSKSGNVECFLQLNKFSPEDITIKWTSTGKQNEDPILYYQKAVTEQSDSLYSTVNWCKIPWRHFLRSVTVTWHHVSLDEPEHRELHITDFPWRPVLGEIEIGALDHGTESKLQCKISGYFPNALTVTWLKEKERNEWVNVKNHPHYKIPDLQHVKQQDHTYSCTAHLDFTASYESDDGAAFICMVEHPSLEGPIERSTGPLQVNKINELCALNQRKTTK